MVGAQRNRHAAGFGAVPVFRDAAEMGEILLVAPHRIDEDVGTFCPHLFDGAPDRAADSADREAQANLDGQQSGPGFCGCRDPAAREKLGHQQGIRAAHQHPRRLGRIQAVIDAPEQ